jgi:hypothetical protein
MFTTRTVQVRRVQQAVPVPAATTVLSGVEPTVTLSVRLQETLFNAVAAFLYASSSSYLSYAVNVFLRPQYLVTPFFQVYPAMTAVYVSAYRRRVGKAPRILGTT